MGVLAALLERVTKAGVFLGGIALIAAMLLTISNILGRPLKIVIPGSYEIFELIMVIPVGFALVYAALKKYHVIVNLIVSRFPPKIGAAAEMLAAFLSFAIWGLMAYAAASLAFETGLKEISETLEIPYLPFRMVWIFCLFLFSLTYLLDFFRSLKRLFEK